MMSTISAVIAVKNEADKIEKCLKHIQWADEIIIVDNGSSDGTVEICKKFTQKIYCHNAPALIPFLQNIGIRKATKEWIIIVDADVIVPESAKKEIIEKIGLPEYDGFYLKHVTYFLGKPLLSPYFGEHEILKLFRNTKGYFKGEYKFDGTRARIMSTSPADIEVKVEK